MSFASRYVVSRKNKKKISPVHNSSQKTQERFPKILERLFPNAKCVLQELAVFALKNRYYWTGVHTFIEKFRDLVSIPPIPHHDRLCNDVFGHICSFITRKEAAIAQQCCRGWMFFIERCPAPFLIIKPVQVPGSIHQSSLTFSGNRYPANVIDVGCTSGYNFYVMKFVDEFLQYRSPSVVILRSWMLHSSILNFPKSVKRCELRHVLNLIGYTSCPRSKLVTNVEHLVLSAHPCRFLSFSIFPHLISLTCHNWNPRNQTTSFFNFMQMLKPCQSLRAVKIKTKVQTMQIGCKMNEIIPMSRFLHTVHLSAFSPNSIHGIVQHFSKNIYNLRVVELTMISPLFWNYRKTNGWIDREKNIFSVGNKTPIPYGKLKHLEQFHIHLPNANCQNELSTNYQDTFSFFATIPFNSTIWGQVDGNECPLYYRDANGTEYYSIGNGLLKVSNKAQKHPKGHVLEDFHIDDFKILFLTLLFD